MTTFFTNITMNRYSARKERFSSYCDPSKPNKKKSLLLSHRISEETMNYMVELYFGSPMPFKAISRNVIDNFMNGKPCNGPQQIDLQIDYTPTRVNNDEIMFTASADIDPEFSIALFEAIIDKYDPIRFEFSKAISDKHEDGNTVVFKVIASVGGSDTLVYCADMSGMP